MITPRFEHVNYLWDDAKAAKLDPVGRLVYRSNILGSDQRITNTGGGNTSAKLAEKDPLTGEPVEVLWVKGSGGDLRTRTGKLLVALQDKLLGLNPRYRETPRQGPKTPAEDAHGRRCIRTARSTSIRAPVRSTRRCTPSFRTSTSITCTRTRSSRSRPPARRAAHARSTATRWPRRRGCGPGFELGLRMQDLCRTHPKCKAILMGQHGLINWADDDKECYELTLDLIEQAARFIEEHDRATRRSAGEVRRLAAADRREVQRQAPALAARPGERGQAPDRHRAGRRRDSAIRQQCRRRRGSPNSAPVAPTISCAPRSSRSTSPGTRRAGTSIAQGAAGRRAGEVSRRLRGYYKRCKHADSPAMRDPNPTVILIPGLGMIAWGKDKSESRVTAEFYNCAVEVMRGAEAIDEYIALPQQEAFDIEYWLLEEAKLKRMPPEKELARQVIAVVGAGSGIGREVAQRLAKEGAHVVCVDLERRGGHGDGESIEATHGAGIGVAGSGISGCGPAIGLRGRHHAARERSRDARRSDVWRTAGSTASPSPPASSSRRTQGRIPDEQWALTFAINVTGCYLVADEAAKFWKGQGSAGQSGADHQRQRRGRQEGQPGLRRQSKAAANHLVRELAIELAPLVRVNGVAPATVVQGIGDVPARPRDRVAGEVQDRRSATTKATTALRTSWPSFYADRTLTKIADHAGRPGRSVFSCSSARRFQDDRPGHHRGRRPARSVPALKRTGTAPHRAAIELRCPMRSGTSCAVLAAVVFRPERQGNRPWPTE